MLLLAGLFFYAQAVPEYLFIVLILILSCWLAGPLIEKSSGLRRRISVMIPLILLIPLLCFFKYSAFYAELLPRFTQGFALQQQGVIQGLIMPLGLSFQTFMAISYLLEINRETIKAERNPLYVALYLLFFPLVASGPIERPDRLIPQFKEVRSFDPSRFSSGFRLMLWGFFKKMVIADRLAVYSEIVYKDPSAYPGFPAIWATLFYSFQIYCDFSAYTDIARGSARMLGFDIMKNFEAPYFSRSLTEFWRRWHISLSTWLRDYVFNPLAVKFRNAGKAGVAAAVIITFTLCGIWHGGNLNFVVWGFLFGIIMAVEAWFKKPKRKKGPLKPLARLGQALQVVLTFTLVTLLWVVFRTDSLSAAASTIASFMQTGKSGFIGVPVITSFSFLMNFVLIALLLISDAILYTGKQQFLLKKRVFNYSFIALMVLLIYVFGIFEKTDFIYNRF
jgi:D-alanyl-lipoteichoic acid acyltransferase DltB (MBOAT superfamily)